MVPAFYLKYAIFGSHLCSRVKSDPVDLTALKKRSWSQNLKSLAQKTKIWPHHLATWTQGGHDILILEKIFTFFLFFEKFWMIPNDKYTWEGQIFILRYFTWSFCITSSLKLYFLQIWWLTEIVGYFQKVLAISCTVVTRYDLFGSKFKFWDWF